MLNYSKARKSVDRTGSKKTLSKGLSGNKSHTSSINIKLSQDLSYAENIKLVPKTHLREKCDPFSQIERVRNTNLSKYSNSNQKQKYSIKLQANEIKDGRDSYVCKDVRDTYNMGKEGGYLCKGSYVGKECVYGCKESINGNAKKDIYDATMMATHTKPLQESNRFMETERYSKEVKNERSLSRNAGSKLRTEYM